MITKIAMHHQREAQATLALLQTCTLLLLREVSRIDRSFIVSFEDAKAQQTLAFVTIMPFFVANELLEAHSAFYKPQLSRKDDGRPYEGYIYQMVAALSSVLLLQRLVPLRDLLSCFLVPFTPCFLELPPLLHRKNFSKLSKCPIQAQVQATTRSLMGSMIRPKIRLWPTRLSAQLKVSIFYAFRRPQPTATSVLFLADESRTSCVRRNSVLCMHK